MSKEKRLKKHHKFFKDEKDFEKVADNYYSIISYFNSLKEVGKTDALFYIEYVKYLRRLYKRVLRNGDLMECYYAGELTESEISGRLSASDVNKTFTEVATHWTLKNRLPHKVNMQKNAEKFGRL